MKLQDAPGRLDDIIITVRLFLFHTFQWSYVCMGITNKGVNFFFLKKENFGLLTDQKVSK